MEPTPGAPKKRKGKTVLLWFLIVILALVLCAFMVLFAAYHYSVDKLNRPDPTETYLSEEELLRQQAAETEPDADYPTLDPTDVAQPGQAALIGQEDQIVNILLVGQDRRPGEGRARSDSMILCSFNKSKGTIQMISFLRDLYVPIPGGYMDNRLNAAYAFGGMKLLDKTLEETFGVEIDANIEVDFSGFSDIIDTLGGVDITLTSAEADYLGLTQGLNHMDGQEALAYSRIRYLDSDFSRTGRQRKVLTALFQQVQQMSLTECLSLANEIFPLLTTDMTNLKVISLATELFPMLPGASLQTLCIPAQGTYSFNNVDGMDVIIADFAANQDLLAETLAPESGE